VHKGTIYSSIAIILHWLMALVIFLLLLSGFSIYFELAEEDSFLFKLYQWHKSLGVTALILIVLRLAWRLTHQPPQIESFSDQELRKAKLGHYLMYLLILVLPLSGWLLVSSSITGVPTIVFDTFVFPHLPVSPSESINTFTAYAHLGLACLLLILIIGHIYFVIHHTRSGHHILKRIKPQSVLQYSVIGLFTLGIISLGANNFSAKQTVVETDLSQSSLQFTGVHAGQKFTGKFSDWSLDSNLLDTKSKTPRFNLNIKTDSVSTGNPFYDETLSETDWLDISNHLDISFVSTKALTLDNSSYQLNGDLTIKGIIYPHKVTVFKTEDTLTSEFTLSRLSLGIGSLADPDAEWVDDEIKINAVWKPSKQ